MPSRLLSRPLATALGGIALTSGLIASYAAVVEPNWAEVVRQSLVLSRLPKSLDGITLAQISDLHVGHFAGARELARSVSTVNALQPDITVVTGDMFHDEPEDAELCAQGLAGLTAPRGVYAIMGNHERRMPPEIGEQPFRRVGLTVLANEAHQISAGGSSLWIVGLDDVIMRRSNITRALQNVPADACKILLVHEPDFADRASQFKIDLQLSGHTHGGQIRLPGIGPLLLPVLGRRYPMGLYRVADMWVYTNRGLGNNRPPLRLNCRPEITLFTLHAP
jgi:predicted MPP superfamily phosphohydrolase